MSILLLRGDFATETRPARNATGRNLWAKDPSSPEADNGTRLDATFVNDLIGLVRGLLSAAGIEPAAGDDAAIAASVIALANARAASTTHDDRYYTQAQIDAALAALGVAGKLSKAGDTMAGDIAMDGHRVTGLADPASNQDAATKAYVDAGIWAMDGKESCRAASTGNVDVTSAPSTMDGVTLAAGNRVMLKNQTAAAENGIRIFTAAGAPLLRASDMDAWVKVPGAFVSIEEGTSNADTSWLCTANQGGTLNTTAINWSQATSPASGVSSFNGRSGTVTPQSGDYTPAQVGAPPTNRSIGVSGLASGGGDLSADRTIAVAKATASDMRGKTQDAAALTPKQAWDAMAEVALAYAATVTPDLATGIDFSIALTGNVTIANPNNIVVGQKGRFRLSQDATGSRTLSLGSYFKWAGGAPSALSTAANAVDFLDYDVVSATFIRVALSKGWA